MNSVLILLFSVLGFSVALNGVANLEFDKFQGTWYLIEIGPPLNSSSPRECIQESYSRNPINPYLADVIWQGGPADNRLQETGWASLPTKVGGDEWKFYLSEMVFHSTILATDYNNWAIEKTVSNADATGSLQGYERIMIRSRERTLDPAVLSTLNAFVRGLGYDTSSFEMINHTGC